MLENNKRSNEDEKSGSEPKRTRYYEQGFRNNASNSPREERSSRGEDRGPRRDDRGQKRDYPEESKKKNFKKPKQHFNNFAADIDSFVKEVNGRNDEEVINKLTTSILDDIEHYTDLRKLVYLLSQKLTSVKKEHKNLITTIISNKLTLVKDFLENEIRQIEATEVINPKDSVDISMLMKSLAQLAAKKLLRILNKDQENTIFSIVANFYELQLKLSKSLSRPNVITGLISTYNFMLGFTKLVTHNVLLHINAETQAVLFNLQQLVLAVKESNQDRDDIEEIYITVPLLAIGYLAKAMALKAITPENQNNIFKALALLNSIKKSSGQGVSDALMAIGYLANENYLYELTRDNLNVSLDLVTNNIKNFNQIECTKICVALGYLVNGGLSFTMAKKCRDVV